MPSAYDDAGLWSLPAAAAWIASLLLLGIGLTAHGRRGRVPSLSLGLPVGCAVAVPVLALASAMRALVPCAWLIGAAGCVLGIRALARERSRIAAQMRRRRPPAALLFATLAAAGCLAWLPSVLRPELSYDALSYHLPVARRFLAGFGSIQGNYYSRLPSAPFLLYAPVVPPATATLEAPGVRLALWCALVAGATLCGRAAGQLGARPAARAAAAALYAWHPMAASAQLNSNSDLFTAMFALAAAERALSALRTRRGADWALAGFLAGTSVATKFSAIGIVLLPMIAGVGAAVLPAPLLGGPARSKAQVLRPFAPFMLFALLAFAPWGIRSTAIGGNPLHPFVGEAPGWSREQNEFLVDRHRPQSPFSAAYWRDAASKADALGYGLSLVPSDPTAGEGGVRVGATLLLVVASLGRLRHRGTRFALVAIGGGCAAWLTVGLAPARFVLPCAGLALALAATTVSKAPFFGLRIGGAALLALAFLFSTLDLVRGGTMATAWRRDAWDRAGLLPENVHRAALDAGGAGRLLVLFEARGRWFPEDAVSNTVWDVPPWAGDLKASESADDFAGRLAARGIDRVFVNEFEWGRLVNFYGDASPKPPMGTVGTGAPRERIRLWLAAYPPCKFAGFDEDELAVLAEFLVLARSRAAQIAPAGPVSTIWLAPIPPTVSAPP